jgi:hypothetical protein
VAAELVVVVQAAAPEEAAVGQPAVAQVEVAVAQQEQARARLVRADQPAQAAPAPVAEGVHRDQEPE